MYEILENKIQQMMPLLNEKQLRRYLGSEAEALGHGGIAIVVFVNEKVQRMSTKKYSTHRTPRLVTLRFE